MLPLSENSALLALKEKIRSEKEIVTGKVKLTAKGFGFLISDERDDLFIPAHVLAGVLPDATITGQVEEKDGKTFISSIESVLDFGHTEFFCRVELFSIDDREYANAFPLRKDLSLKVKLGNNSKKEFADGDILLVKLNPKPSAVARVPVFNGKCVKKIGPSSDPETMWNLIKSEFDLNEKLANVSVNGYPDMSEYEDWTKVPFVTIDSYSSKDLDDALYVEDSGDHWTQYIAIADPTLMFDKQPSLRFLFFERGVTHYLANEIVHLMMTSYSEHCFSLLQDEVRPSLCSVIKICKDSGEIQDASFHMAAISSKAKLTYDQVSEHINQKAVPAIDSSHKVVKSLNNLWDLSKKRKEYRQNNFLVGVEDGEYFFSIEDGLPNKIIEVKRKLSHQMVEEAAILANEAFTNWATDKGEGVIFVTHKGFLSGKEKNLRDYLSARGFPQESYKEVGDLFNPSHHYFMEKYKESLETKDDYKIALAKRNITELRAFYQKGELSLQPSPHCPMGMKRYATWTSPIRKALDMNNHLFIKSKIRDSMPVTLSTATSEMVDIIQERNRSSRLAERKLSQLLGATYMKQFVGKKVVVKLDGVMKNAIRVRIKDTGIVSTMSFKELGFKGYVEFNSVEQVIYVDAKPEIKLGDEFDVNVSRVSVYDNEIVLLK